MNCKKLLLTSGLVFALSGAAFVVSPGDKALAQDEAAGSDDGIPTLVVTNRPLSRVLGNDAPVRTGNVSNASASMDEDLDDIRRGVDAPVYASPNRTPRITPRNVMNEEYFTPVDTMASRKIVEIREEMFDLQSRVADLSDQLAEQERLGQELAANYYANIATINTQLQAGTTPGNPRLLEHMTEAQASLDTLAGSVADLNTLALQVADTASMAAFLQESTRAAYALTGAVEEDHARLAQLEDATANTVTIIERLLNNVNDDIARSSAYLASERSNLRTLSLAIANGDLYGRSLSNRPFSSVSATTIGLEQNSAGAMLRPNAPMVMGAPIPRMAPSQPRPLVVIRFDDPNVEYEQAVYMAMNDAMERYPDARFELVAVNPSSGNAAKVAIEKTRARRNAEKVLRTISQMGLASDRIDLSSLENENIMTNEVHIYIR